MDGNGRSGDLAHLKNLKFWSKRLCEALSGGASAELTFVFVCHFKCCKLGLHWDIGVHLQICIWQQRSFYRVFSAKALVWFLLGKRGLKNMHWET